MVVDGDVDILPTGRGAVMALVALAPAIAGDAMADTIEATELLDVHMDDFAWRFALIARAWLVGLEGGQQAEATPLENTADGRPAEAEFLGDVVLRATSPAQDLDRFAGGPRRLAWRGMGPGGPVGKPGNALRAKPAQPLGDGLGRCLETACGLSLRHGLIHDGANHGLSTFRRKMGILVNVHSVLRRITDVG